MKVLKIIVLNQDKNPTLMIQKLMKIFLGKIKQKHIHLKAQTPSSLSSSFQTTRHFPFYLQAHWVVNRYSTSPHKNFACSAPDQCTPRRLCNNQTWIVLLPAVYFHGRQRERGPAQNTTICLKLVLWTQNRMSQQALQSE